MIKFIQIWQEKMKIVEHFLEHLCTLTVFWYCDLFQIDSNPQVFQHYVILVQLLWIVWLHWICRPLTADAFVKLDTPKNKTEELVLRKVALLVRRLEQFSSEPPGQEQPSSTAAGHSSPSPRRSRRTSGSSPSPGPSPWRSGRTSGSSPSTGTSPWRSGRTFTRRSASPCSRSPMPLFYSGSPPQNQRRDLHDFLGKSKVVVTIHKILRNRILRHIQVKALQLLQLERLVFLPWSNIFKNIRV